MCLWIVKFIVFWMLLGNGAYIFGMSLVLGICIYLLFQGVTYFGIYLTITTLLILGILSFIIMFNFIFNRKINVKAFMIAFLISFITLGIGFSYTSIEIATTKFSTQAPENFEKKKMKK